MSIILYKINIHTLCYSVQHHLKTFINYKKKTILNAEINNPILSYPTYYTILLYYTILYYTILYYTILYYTILYYTILYYTVLYCTVLYCTKLLLTKQVDSTFCAL